MFIRLDKFLMNYQNDMDIRYINGDLKDCRRENMRLVKIDKIKKLKGEKK